MLFHIQQKYLLRWHPLLRAFDVILWIYFIWFSRFVTRKDSKAKNINVPLSYTYHDVMYPSYSTNFIHCFVLAPYFVQFIASLIRTSVHLQKDVKAKELKKEHYIGTLKTSNRKKENLFLCERRLSKIMPTMKCNDLKSYKKYWFTKKCDVPSGNALLLYEI